MVGLTYILGAASAGRPLLQLPTAQAGQWKNSNLSQPNPTVKPPAPPCTVDEKKGYFKISCVSDFQPVATIVIIFDLNSLSPLSLSFSSAVADHVSVRDWRRSLLSSISLSLSPVARLSGSMGSGTLLRAHRPWFFNMEYCPMDLQPVVFVF